MNLQQLMQAEEATKVIVKAAGVINEIDKKNGKVGRSTIAQAEAIKVPLLQLVLSSNPYAVSAKYTLEAINEAITFVEGDLTAKQRYLDACQRANELNRRINEVSG